MSGGTPRAGGYMMRQRYSQEYGSSSDDLEEQDDALSRPSQPISKPQIIETILWLTSAAFFVYLGDRKSNLISLLWGDDRINRIALYLGLVGNFFNVGFILYTILFTRRGIKKVDEIWEASPPSAAPVVTINGLISFCLLSFALWPIWSFLTLPLLFTLCMAFIVISPYLPIGTFSSQDRRTF
ncbi:testis- and ovary-specific PAZ domain protein [Tasmannia lanceolata]|uniref:testis- and ovary-specific PAZ domain protein n=1 Tax=Tasmannia lanceolata TaxID=3420 RepID=UPI0040639E37